MTQSFSVLRDYSAPLAIPFTQSVRSRRHCGCRKDSAPDLHRFRRCVVSAGSERSRLHHLRETVCIVAGQLFILRDHNDVPSALHPHISLEIPPNLPKPIHRVLMLVRDGRLYSIDILVIREDAVDAREIRLRRNPVERRIGFDVRKGADGTSQQLLRGTNRL